MGWEGMEDRPREDGQLVIKGIGSVIGVCNPTNANVQNNTGIQL